MEAEGIGTTGRLAQLLLKKQKASTCSILPTWLFPIASQIHRSDTYVVSGCRSPRRSPLASNVAEAIEGRTAYPVANEDECGIVRCVVASGVIIRTTDEETQIQSSAAQYECEGHP